MRALRHPNLLPMFCSFTRTTPAPDALCLVLPFVPGGSLEDILRSQFPTGMVRGRAFRRRRWAGVFGRRSRGGRSLAAMRVGLTVFPFSTVLIRHVRMCRMSPWWQP